MAQASSDTIPRSATLSETFEFAEEQYEQGWFDRAERTYKRVLFFDVQNEYRGRCMEVLADLAMKKDRYHEALNYLDQAYFLTEDHHLKSAFQLDRIKIFIQTDQMQKALAEIYQTSAGFDENRTKLYEGYCHYWLKDFEAAKISFSDLIETNELLRAIQQAEKIERMNPKFYQTMSYIIPGFGQILLGDVKQSLNSLLLNGGLAVLFINTARRLSFFDGAIAVLPWFQRYYSGGAKLTRQLALDKKKKRHQRNLQKMLDQISGD